MRMRSPVLPLLGLLTLAAIPAGAQEARTESADVAKIRDERFKWFIGAQGGAMFFGTQLQTQSGIPTGGVHLGVVARRAGLLLSVEEGFGKNEPTAFRAVFVDGSVLQSTVDFDRLRRYTFTLTGYPVRGAAQPYFGIGFGILQVINPELTGTFVDEAEAAVAQFLAQEVSTTGFLHFTAGVQVRAGGVALFGQYQIGTSPNQSNVLDQRTDFPVLVNNLTRGTSHSLMGGVRVSLGRAKQEITGGGY
ncbi:MAG: hypothetical protein ACRENB_11365 [Gemmatimonadales bacterium]